MLETLVMKINNAKTILDALKYEKNSAISNLDYWKNRKANATKENTDESPDDSDIEFWDTRIEEAQDLVSMFNNVEQYIVKLVKDSIK